MRACYHGGDSCTSGSVEGAVSIRKMKIPDAKWFIASVCFDLKTRLGEAKQVGRVA